MENPFNVIKTLDIHKMIHLLENGLSPNKKNIFGVSLIEYAMKEQIYNMVLTLYQKGADISKIKNIDENVIFCANQSDMEDFLFKKTKDAIQEFPISNKNSTIYTFGFEYRYEYGSVIISLNSVEDFNSTLKDYQNEYPENYRSPDKIERLKYNPGDWKYQDYKSFTIIPKFNEEHFIRSLKNVLDKLKNNNIFDYLKVTKDFKYDIYEYD